MRKSLCILALIVGIAALAACEEEIVTPESAGTSDRYTSDIHYLQGIISFDKGDYNSAIAEFSKAIESDPLNTQAYYMRGLTYATFKEDYDMAFTDFNKVIEVDPYHAGAYNGLGQVYAAKEDYGRALSHFDKAIRWKSDYAEPYYFRGLIYASRGDYDSAISDFNKVIEIDPSHIRAKEVLELVNTSRTRTKTPLLDLLSQNP